LAVLTQFLVSRWLKSNLLTAASLAFLTERPPATASRSLMHRCAEESTGKKLTIGTARRIFCSGTASAFGHV